METAIVSAINGVAGTLLITAAGDGGATQVNLTHDSAGSAGNVTITEAVADGGFTVAGMSGGLAGDCPSTTGCGSNDDCTLNCTSLTCM